MPQAPYGLYDLTHNQGHVHVGTSGDTPQFAADSIRRCGTTRATGNIRVLNTS